jgi:predicted GH43/DUF377 family glycosyl hydrolase
MRKTIVSLLLLTAGPLWAQNPIYGTDFFADPKPHLWADGRVYLYPSHDVSTKYWCSDDYHVLSSSDLVDWKDDGVSLRQKDAGLPDNSKLYACDVIFKDGLYHLYASTSSSKFVMLSSSSPTGPFTDPHVLDLKGIDPGVLVDNDGQVYIYWGQLDKVRAARLKPNLYEIDPETVVQPLNVKDFGFHEGSSVVKRGDTYYYIYASTIRKKRPTCLAYATSKSPLGPFTYGGVIIDNTGCDPQVWNNHGRIFEFKGRWYVFHHRSTHGTKYLRQVCVEPITFNPDGSIPEVKMSSNGAGPLLPVTKQILATRACQLSGKAFLALEEPDPELILTNIHDGDAAYFRRLDFSATAPTVALKIRGGHEGDRVELHEGDPSGPLLGTVTLDAPKTPEQWRVCSARVAVPPRVKDLCFVFKSQGPTPLSLASFRWE